MEALQLTDCAVCFEAKSSDNFLTECNGCKKSTVCNQCLATWNKSCALCRFPNPNYVPPQGALANQIVDEAGFNNNGYLVNVPANGTINISNDYHTITTEMLHLYNLESSITTINLDEYVQVASRGAFRDMTSLTTINMPPIFQLNGFEIFAGCTSLQTITIPANNNRIPRRAFMDCTSLHTITIPETVTKIESKAFSGCTSLTNISISRSITNIADDAFEGCPIESITFF